MKKDFIPDLRKGTVLITGREISTIAEVLESAIRKELRKEFMTTYKTNPTEITEDWITDLDHTLPMYSMVKLYEKIYLTDYIVRLHFNILKHCKQ